jgi:hypothetical protein
MMKVEDYKKLLVHLYGDGDLSSEGVWEDSYIKILDEAIDALDPRHARILRGRMEGRTLREIGAEEGVTPVRIGQLEAKSLRLLRHPHRLKLGRYIRQTYLCEYQPTGEKGVGSFEHDGVTRTYEYERKKCTLCGEYQDEQGDSDVRCASKIVVCGDQVG